MTAADVAMTAAREDRRAAPRAVLVGLIGSGIQASRTPAMHEREGAAQGLAYVYKIIDLDTLGLTAAALPELLTAARRFGFAGLNITHPCKQAVIPLLDDLSPDARALGAVNTVVFGRDGRAVGHNTDWSGFAEAFRRTLPDVARRRVVQFGAAASGPAARARRTTRRARCATPTASSTPRRSAWRNTRACRSRANCCGRSYGSPTSSTFRSRPSCWRTRARSAAAPWAAAAWRCSRRPTPSACSAGASPTPSA
jgi:hypothetical protein